MAEITQCTTVTGLLKSDKPRRGARENITYLVLNRSELLVVLFRSNIWGHSQSTNNKTEADEEKFLRFNRWLPGEYVGRKIVLIRYTVQRGLHETKKKHFCVKLLL